ncbi:MAG: NUDIX domain-containing protein [Oscillospiraceae bacterium]|nr:NUDIX domain-containing protein [Oscillospiraceae bacterium]
MAETVEMLDIYDKNGNKTGITRKRSEPMKNGEYHRIVHVWIKNSENKFIITKRSPEKRNCPNMWECTAGFIFAGEESSVAALREVKEETGFILNLANGELIYSFINEDYIHDIWLFNENVDIKTAVLEKGGTCDIKWAVKDEILRIIEKGEFVPYMEYVRDIF